MFLKHARLTENIAGCRLLCPSGVGRPIQHFMVYGPAPERAPTETDTTTTLHRPRNSAQWGFEGRETGW